MTHPFIACMCSKSTWETFEVFPYTDKELCYAMFFLELRQQLGFLRTRFHDEKKLKYLLQIFPTFSEMFEHMKNYEKLLAKIAKWLQIDGKLFVHIFTHKTFSYHFNKGNFYVLIIISSNMFQIFVI